MAAWPKDITRQDVQSYLLEYYSHQNAPAHQPLTSEQTRCVLSPDAPATKPMLSYPQAVLTTVMQGFASKPDTTNRGMLVWWSVGSGKTLTATAVMDSFWDTPKNIVFATSIEASNSNPPSTFHKYAQEFFPRFKGMSLDEVKRAFEKRKVRFFTFATLAHHLLIAHALKRVKTDADKERHMNLLKDAVLIIDEVHNIFKPLPNQKLENTALKHFLQDYNNPRTSNMKLVILSATPGDTPTDVVALLNMVRDTTRPPIRVPDTRDPLQVEAFGNEIRGLISYFDMSRDGSRFPRVISERPVRRSMSTQQYERYAKAYNEEPNALRNSNALSKDNQLGKYFKHARRYSNMLYDFEKDMMIDEFSSKLPALLEVVKQHPNDKHYIYSSFYENRAFGGHGILAIAKVLERELGYEKMSVAQAKTINSQGFDGIPERPRYVLAISNELGDDRNKLKTIVTAFNSPQNARGQFVHVFLASQGYNEGIDLKGVRHVHIFEPLLTFAAETQTIGRAARFCSHADLDRDRGEWSVRVHRYLSEEPADLSMFNLNYLRDRVEYLGEETARLKEKLAVLKGKGANYQSLREKTTAQVKEYEGMLRELTKKYSKVEKMNLKNVRMIDAQIQQEALEKSREMLVLHGVMKKAAVDYLLFQEYHEGPI
jgi:Type III restriction enzyme, res subunit/Helicase conserved C-terminal domain